MSVSPRIDLKSAQLSALQLALRTRAMDELGAQLRAQWGEPSGAGAGLFEGEALCLELSELPAGAALDWPQCLQLLRAWGLRPVALCGHQALSEAEKAAALALGLALVDVQTARSLPAEPAAAPAAPGPMPPAAAPVGPGTLVVDRPLRSGQQVYARGADLVVLGLVSHGAEVIADGHIHVYGALRGRAIAGARGQADARIYAHSLEAELVSIAGTFRTAEKPLPAEVLAKPAQVRLDGERLVFEPLKF